MTTLHVRRSATCGLLALAAIIAGGCSSGGNTHGPGPAAFTFLNDSSATVDVEMVTVSGQPTLTVAPGGSATSSIEPSRDTSDGALELILLPMDPESGAIGRPSRVTLDGPPYAMRVFGTASAIRWARVTRPNADGSADLAAPPPPNPGAGVQAR